MSVVTREDLLKVSDLLKINFSDADIERNIEFLDNIFKWIDSGLDEAIGSGDDVDFIRPSVIQQGLIREDVVDDGGYKSVILSNSKNANVDYFRIVKVINKN